MFINETHSTSTLLRQQYSDELPHLYAIRTDFQTAGRGQTGNGWESEKGKNLLVSVLLKYPEIAASEQWRLSMLVAVTLYEAIAQFVPEQMLTIKWPNDIYYGEKKMAGILLENFLQGPYIQYSIAGVGVNVNQTEWVSDAPNCKAKASPRLHCAVGSPPHPCRRVFFLLSEPQCLSHRQASSPQ